MPELTNLKNLRVILIDDDEFILQQTRLILGQLDITQIIGCTDGAQAMQLFDSGEQYDLALIDLNMPVMDGIEVLRNLAQREFCGAIILFSGEDARILRTAQNLASAHKLNVLGALHKPICVESIQAILSQNRSVTSDYNRQHESLQYYDELSIALKENEILPYFQPQVKISDRSITSVEVLARWNHPQFGLIPPSVFIPVAEEHGIIDLLTQKILAQALAYFSQWRSAGYRFTMSVNLSADSLDVMDLPEKIADMVGEYNVPCDCLVLELTEGRVVHSQTKSLDVLTRLRLKGFGLSIDDFGTHYSTMSQLNNIPFTELKVDRAFVHNSASDATANAILNASVQLAKNLNMTTIAEGVETEQDWEQVARSGCDLVQGYLVAKPMPADEFTLWIAQHRS